MPETTEQLISRISKDQAEREAIDEQLVNDLPTPDTIEHAIQMRDDWFKTALFHCRNEEYYRGLVTKIGEMFGEPAYTSDDGSVQQDVLCAKVPELVAAELSLIDSLRTDISRLNVEIERVTRRQQGPAAERRMEGRSDD